jgi:hypothetical protein
VVKARLSPPRTPSWKVVWPDVAVLNSKELAEAKNKG